MSEIRKKPRVRRLQAKQVELADKEIIVCVNSPVYSPRYGEGKVIEIIANVDQPPRIRVEFPGGRMKYDLENAFENGSLEYRGKHVTMKAMPLPPIMQETIEDKHHELEQPPKRKKRKKKKKHAKKVEEQNVSVGEKSQPISMLDAINNDNQITLAVVTNKVEDRCSECGGCTFQLKFLDIPVSTHSTLKMKIDGVYCTNCHMLFTTKEKVVDDIIEKCRISWMYKKVKYKQEDSKKRILSEIDIRKLALQINQEGINRNNTMYVHGDSIICQRKRHLIIPVKADLDTLFTGRATINADYCIECKKCFISQFTYEEYRKRYHFLPIRLIRVPASGEYPNESINNEIWAEESPLMMCGYTVRQKSKLTAKNRCDILASVIENGVLSKPQVIRYLESFIDLNSGRYNKWKAVARWRSDLSFVRQYNMEQQPEVKILSISPWRVR